ARGAGGRGPDGRGGEVPGRAVGRDAQAGGIARAIALRPRYLLYDEPTTGLHPVTSAVIDQLVVRTRQHLGVTGIVVTHRLRGVRVGRVEGIRLASGNWVEADLKIYAGAQPPPRPAVIAASASLFGEWAASLVSLDQLPNDPNIKQAIAEAQAAGSGKWPGATLPDIGQLTAQASRIATDIATVSSRIQTALDSEAVLELRRSIKG